MKRVVISSGKVSDTFLDCPFLEDLSMIDCYGFGKIEFCYRLKRLKILVVRNCKPLSDGGIELVYLPNLEYFEYIGCFVRFEVDGLDEIHEIFLDFRIESDQPHDRDEMQETLSGFTQALFLTISMHTFKMLPREYMSYPEFLYLGNLSKLTLITCMYYYELAGICNLAEKRSLSDNSLHFIDLNLHGAWRYGYDGSDGFWLLQDWDLDCLKYGEITGLTGKETEYDVLKFLMKNAVNLNKLSIDTITFND